jgi:hypothetical protein
MTITTSAPVLAAALHRLIVARVEFAPLKDQRGMGSVYSRSRDQDRVLEPGLVESGSRRLEQGEPFLLEEVVGLSHGAAHDRSHACLGKLDDVGLERDEVCQSATAPAASNPPSASFSSIKVGIGAHTPGLRLRMEPLLTVML